MRSQKHIETLMMTSLILLETSRQNESNNIKKGYQWWPELSHMLYKDKWATHYLWSPLVIFIGIIRFV